MPKLKAVASSTQEYFVAEGLTGIPTSYGLEVTYLGHPYKLYPGERLFTSDALAAQNLVFKTATLGFNNAVDQGHTEYVVMVFNSNLGVAKGGLKIHPQPTGDWYTLAECYMSMVPKPINEDEAESTLLPAEKFVKYGAKNQFTVALQPDQLFFRRKGSPIRAVITAKVAVSASSATILSQKTGKILPKGPYKWLTSTTEAIVVDGYDEAVIKKAIKIGYKSEYKSPGKPIAVGGSSLTKADVTQFMAEMHNMQDAMMMKKVTVSGPIVNFADLAEPALPMKPPKKKSKYTLMKEAFVKFAPLPNFPVEWRKADLSKPQPQGEYGYEGEFLASPDVDANLITSKLLTGGHIPVLDLDFPAKLIPSSTPGHHHLILGKALTLVQYEKLLDALTEAGILEAGFTAASKQRGYTAIRAPWVKKDPGPAKPKAKSKTVKWTETKAESKTVKWPETKAKYADAMPNKPEGFIAVDMGSGTWLDVASPPNLAPVTPSQTIFGKGTYTSNPSYDLTIDSWSKNAAPEMFYKIKPVGWSTTVLVPSTGPAWQYKGKGGGTGFCFIEDGWGHCWIWWNNAPKPKGFITLKGDFDIWQGLKHFDIWGQGLKHSGSLSGYSDLFPSSQAPSGEFYKDYQNIQKALTGKEALKDVTGEKVVFHYEPIT